MSEGPVLGIDLGTTNSVVAVADGGQARVLTDEEGRRLLPSVVSFHPNGTTLVGYEARERRLVDAENTVYAVKRLIGRPYGSAEVTKARERFAFSIGKSKHGSAVVEVRRGKYALAEISAMVLRELRRLAEAQLGEACSRAVITVPANFNELQRSATKAAGKVAGLDVLRIINEPTAAALAYGFGKGSSEKIAVYDLGGGTFDFTVLELDDEVFEVLATGGDTFLGGEDVDTAIADQMSERFLSRHKWDPRTDGQAYERLKAAAEWAKCELSTEESAEMRIEELTHGRGGKALDLQYTLKRSDLDDLSRPWIQRTYKVCDEVLRHAGVSSGEISNVVLVGGMTRMPLVHEMVEAYFGQAPKSNIDPDLIVAQGAAIHGYAIGGAPPSRAAAQKRSTLGRVLLKRMSKEQVAERRSARKRKRTMGGIPDQPAFSPEERPPSDVPPNRPMRPSVAPPPVPDLPDAPTGIHHIEPPTSIRQVDAVLSSPVVTVTTPKSTLDIELDDLEPTSDMPEAIGALDDLAPPELSNPFAAEVDPFSAPQRGATPGGTYPPAGPASAAPLDDPFGGLDMPLSAPLAPAVPAIAPSPAQLPVPKAALPGPPPPPSLPAPPAPPAAPAPPVRSAPPPSPPVAPPAPAPRAPVGAPPPQPSLAQEVVAMPASKAPILMDVTPHSLGIETVGGYCRRLIGKNAPIPTEQTKVFTTARDEQVEVVVRICQGESNAFEENQVLGEVVLDSLAAMSRGQLQIEVAFILDTDGTLAVQAKDAASGRSTHTRINLRGGLSHADVEAMRARLAAEGSR